MEATVPATLPATVPVAAAPALDTPVAEAIDATRGIAARLRLRAAADTRPVLGCDVPCTFARIRQRWPMLLPLALLVPLAMGIAATIDGGRLLVWDAPLTAHAVALRSPWIDDIARIFSRLGAWTVVYPVAALLAAIAARRSRTLALAIVVVVASRPALEWLLKDVVARPRPTGDRMVNGTGYSFPSGHPLAAAATWAFLPPVVALYTRSRAVWWASVGVAGGIVGMVAWSRVWLGVHWTSDVVASLFLAFSAFSAVELWLDRKRLSAAPRPTAAATA